MTFRVHFYAEQAFLSQTKSLLEQANLEEEPEISALCILACASAVEAVANSLLSKTIGFRHFDELKISSKIEQILLFAGTEPNWGIQPWQSISQLIRTRNWLTHYKDFNVGLVNSDFVWLKDDHNKLPKIDPYIELTFVRSRTYYDHSRMALRDW